MKRWIGLFMMMILASGALAYGTNGNQKEAGTDVSLKEPETEEDIRSEEKGGEDAGAEEDGAGLGEAESGMDANSEGAAGAGAAVAQAGPYGSISITLPEGWSYELCGVDDESLMAGDYGIHFYPEDAAEGFIELAYASQFGVCGTGLETVKTTLAGEEAEIGYYGDAIVWEYVAWSGALSKIVALAYDVDGWDFLSWDEVWDEVMETLDTVVFDAEAQSGAIAVESDDSRIDEFSLFASLKDITATQATLVFGQRDPSVPGNLTFGGMYSLEKKDGDTWSAVDVVAEGEYAFYDVAYLIEKDAQTEHTYDWEWLYGALEAGDYRLKTSVYYGNGEEGSPHEVYDIYLYFLLREE